MHDSIQVNPTSRRSRLSPHPLLVPKQATPNLIKAFSSVNMQAMQIPIVQDLVDPDVCRSQCSVF